MDIMEKTDFVAEVRPYMPEEVDYASHVHIRILVGAIEGAVWIRDLLACPVIVSPVGSHLASDVLIAFIKI